MRRQFSSIVKKAFHHQYKQLNVLQPSCTLYSHFGHQRLGLFSSQHRFLSSTSEAKSDPQTETVSETTDVEAEVVDEAVEESNEKVTGEAKSHSFKAETKRILEIVARSLYTDKEIFIRELISNASDALEKARYLQNTKELIGDEELQIRISLNEAENTITITDTGIGMSKDQLVQDLGTIARSGSKEFVEKLADEGGNQDIIGQFGVGFYSAFMVSNKVEVFTLSGDAEKDVNAWHWSSDGEGVFDLSKAEGVNRGTKIIIHLKESCKEFSLKHQVEGIIKKHSNFVGFPIYLNGKELNQIGAVWTKDPQSIDEEEHTGFYRHIANAYDSPTYRLHFRTDAPIDINALFYFPERHMEKYGMGRLDPGVSLYCRKVLIEAECKQLLPEWLRFVKGVVDSEDIPLNISRENMQDSALIRRMNTVLTKKVIRFIADEAKKDTAKYHTWFQEFGNFIKEGVCTDFANKEEISKILRFDSSAAKDEHISLDDYVSRMPPSQKNIYYLNAPSRDVALNSPYYLCFEKENIEVLFLYSTIDDFVMKNLGKYNKRTLMSAESGSVDFQSKDDEKVDSKEHEPLIEFFTKALGDKAQSVTVTKRPINSPAIIVDHESSSYRKMMQYVNDASVQGGGAGTPAAKVKVEIDPEHNVCKKLNTLRDINPDMATLIVEQVFDNALMAADILDKPQMMLDRLNKILEHASAS